MADAVNDNAGAPVDEGGRDAGLAKRVLRKIDRTIIPLLFVTYILNFMDKIILSSAAIFGLRDDNVSSMPGACLRGCPR